MSIRLQAWSTNGINQFEWNPDFGWDSNSPVNTDGFQFTFGPNEDKNFLDDGPAIALAANVNGTKVDTVVEDPIPFGSSRS
jgi:hypothetical protein